MESDAFRRELDKQTSKGLHLEGNYQNIRRTGFLTATAEGFTGKNGVKAFKAISTGKVDARFNPWGIFLRRWELDHILIESGKAEIQTYEPKSENKPPKPGMRSFCRTGSTCKKLSAIGGCNLDLRGRQAGFFKTKLLITPYGRDFEYWASGGMMKQASSPDLTLSQLHLLITKEELTLYDMELAPNLKSEGRIRVTGRAGLKQDKSLAATMTFSEIPVDPWIPEAWASLIKGRARGDVTWEGPDMKMEGSSGRGTFRIEGGRVSGASFLEEAATITGKKSIEDIELSQCSLAFDWKYPRAEIKQIEIEAKGAFSIRGTVVIENKRLDGSLKFGATRKYLEWLPRANEIFSQERDGYLWTVVNLDGTLQKPKEDLSPRIAELLKKSPGAAVGIFFRKLGEWFEKKRGGR